ncbi:MAG TPA: PAS domain S-box protein, partial [Thermotogota bacterium]|nr:PAS domain S-box protein [Thermotogota bacterium]
MRGDEKDLFEMVMENTRVGFGVAQTLKDSEGRVSDLQFLECNPPFEAIVGHAGETLRGKLWSALRKQSPNKDFDWLEAFQKCPQNDSSCSFSFFSSTLGRVVWVECRLSRPDTWVCSCVPHPNEKERSVLEKRLLDNRHRWEFALEGSDLGVWEENLETGEAFYSDKWKEMLGYGPDEIVPNMQSWRDRVHPDDRENVQREIDRHLSGQMSISSHEHRLRCKDGSYKWILSRGKIIERSADGTPLRAIGTHADIDARKRAENEAKKQSALITSLLDSIPDIIFFKDLEGVYLGCNSEFARHVGKRKEEIIGSTDYDLYPQAEADAFRENDQIMLMLGTTRHNEEWIRYPDGREVLLDTLKTPYRDENGKLVGVLGISRDITQSKKIQEEFEIVFEGTQDELFLVQVCPDGTFRYIRNNPA